MSINTPSALCKQEVEGVKRYNLITLQKAKCETTHHLSERINPLTCTTKEPDTANLSLSKTSYNSYVHKYLEQM